MATTNESFERSIDWHSVIEEHVIRSAEDDGSRFAALPAQCFQAFTDHPPKSGSW